MYRRGRISPWERRTERRYGDEKTRQHLDHGTHGRRKVYGVYFVFLGEYESVGPRRGWFFLIMRLREVVLCMLLRSLAFFFFLS